MPKSNLEHEGMKTSGTTSASDVQTVQIHCKHCTANKKYKSHTEVASVAGTRCAAATVANGTSYADKACGADVASKIGIEMSLAALVFTKTCPRDAALVKITVRYPGVPMKGICTSSVAAVGTVRTSLTGFLAFLFCQRSMKAILWCTAPFS